MSSSAAEEEGRKQVLVTAVVGFEESMGEKNGEDGRRFLKKKRENEKPFQVFINGFSFFFSSKNPLAPICKMSKKAKKKTKKKSMSIYFLVL